MKKIQGKEMMSELQRGNLLTQLGAAFDVLSAVTGNPKLPIQQARVFVYVAERGEALQGDMEEVANIAQSSVSRNLSLLSEGVPGKKPGYGLLEVTRVPHNRRRNHVRLTEKGKALAWDMQEALLSQ